MRSQPRTRRRQILRLQCSEPPPTTSGPFRQITDKFQPAIAYGSITAESMAISASQELPEFKQVDPPQSGRADLHLKWDKQKTKRLILNPVPAPFVRQFVWPRAAVANISGHSALIRRLERHAMTSQSATSASKAPTTLTYTPPGSVTVHRRHDSLITPVRTRLETRGWAQTPFDVAPRRVDLAMAKGSHILLAEFKTIGRSTYKPVREAFAQLHEYAWRRRALQKKDNRQVLLWAIFESKPQQDDVEFLEDADVLVSWANRSTTRIQHGKTSQRRLARLGV